MTREQLHILSHAGPKVSRETVTDIKAYAKPCYAGRRSGHAADRSGRELKDEQFGSNAAQPHSPAPLRIPITVLAQSASSSSLSLCDSSLRLLDEALPSRNGRNWEAFLQAMYYSRLNDCSGLIWSYRPRDIAPTIVDRQLVRRTTPGTQIITR